MPRRPVDIVAIILAAALGILVVLIMVASTIQIVAGGRPAVRLSDNATTVIAAAIGGVSGLLGGYIGSHAHRDDDG